MDSVRSRHLDRQQQCSKQCDRDKRVWAVGPHAVGVGATSGLGPEGGLDGPACAIAQGWAARGWRCRLGLL